MADHDPNPKVFVSERDDGFLGEEVMSYQTTWSCSR